MLGYRPLASAQDQQTCPEILQTPLKFGCGKRMCLPTQFHLDEKSAFRRCASAMGESAERTIQGLGSVAEVLFFLFGGWRRSHSAVASTYCLRNKSSGCSPACAAGEAKNCAARTNFRNVASSSLLNRSRNEGSSLAVIEPRYSPDWGWTS